MYLKKWDDLPDFMKCSEVREYYEILESKKASIAIKRIFDIIFSLILIIILGLPMLIISILIKLDSSGPIFYRQERVTAYGKKFKIHKFRTMINNAEKVGASVTLDNDNRITKIGNKIRKYRIDEFPQIFDVLVGNMSFVGTRPEVPKYVEMYTDKMLVTLLLPAGITSEASIKYKDEAALLKRSSNVDEEYMNNVLPSKMKYNIKMIENFSLYEDIKIMFFTIKAVLVN